ncbi:RES family NAD+ phosphorylase [Gloeothece verrucosa]|uniref:RES domain protein n=1 Tax=Gloeothece verrucosa (strain PCC 7822) TaxID=497965 RepID=E0U5T6_GLOV7|nr:RES family NAD+ phosphorylase [Gloeothece verrucosa]ADN15927.1 RES domain protein [Gloeothece verrucosa PCC 7822]
MVKIAPPPPINSPSPIIYELSVDDYIIRIFDPTKYQTQALTFRYYGPISRFDHHRGSLNNPQNDSERGIYYAAFTLSGCLVECFGDTGVIEIKDQCVAQVQLTRTIKLLDLRGSAAMKAGSVAALAKDADRKLTQTWSRYFYEQDSIYSVVDGIIYYNAHNDEKAVALFERAKSALFCPPEQVIRLDDPELTAGIEEAALNNNLIIQPYTK